MIRDTFQLVSISRKSIGNGDSSRRLALGIAMGMVIGLIPKDSLLAWFFFVILMISTGNLLCALGSGFVFSWIGYLLDSFTHKLGGIALTNDSLQPVWLWLSDLPVVPWTRFNNTVVMGSLIAGIVLFIPVCLLSHEFFEKFGGKLSRQLRNNVLHRWLFGPESSGAEVESG